MRGSALNKTFLKHIYIEEHGVPTKICLLFFASHHNWNIAKNVRSIYHNLDQIYLANIMLIKEGIWHEYGQQEHNEVSGIAMVVW